MQDVAILSLVKKSKLSLWLAFRRADDESEKLAA
jgi:hypothetical protein